jgi:acetolactate synthase-1/2/3 large subunit
MAVLSEALADPLSGAHVFVDSGNCVGWALGHLVIDPPTELHSSLAMGPMGFAVAGVVGAKLACPDRPCVAIAGDGAMLMHGSEISTARQYGAAAIWFVLDDGDLGMVTQGMAQYFGKAEPGVAWEGRYALGADLVPYAESLGAEAVRVNDEADLAAGLERAAKGAAEGLPQVVVVPIDRSLVPPYYPVAQA